MSLTSDVLDIFGCFQNKPKSGFSGVLSPDEAMKETRDKDDSQQDKKESEDNTPEDKS